MIELVKKEYQVSQPKEENMITFEEVCKRFGLDPEQVREVIKGEFKIDIVSDRQQQSFRDRLAQEIWSRHKYALENRCALDKNDVANTAIQLFKELMPDGEPITINNSERGVAFVDGRNSYRQELLKRIEE